MEKIYDILIIGGGPAGFSAALYGARAGLSVLVLEKLCAGGQMALTGEIENYPGFRRIAGFDLAGKMRDGAEAAGAEVRYEAVEKLHLTVEPKVVTTKNAVYHGRTVILATGATPRKLGLDGEAELTGRGIHYCAHCDGHFYKGKTVAVIGGGNTAVQDALYLAGLCEKVILIHRSENFRAAPASLEKARKEKRIEFYPNTTLRELLIRDRLYGLLLQTPEGMETRFCEGLFVAIGYEPVSSLSAGQLPLTEQGYIDADESTKTGIPGVFAAGDVRQKPLRQVITAASDGAAAADAALKYLQIG